MSMKFRALVSPLAIGIYFAVISTGIAKKYYNSLDSTRPSLFFRALQEIDRQSIDTRFKLRGPRPGDPNIAILAIDDRSVNIVGRWPWPRAVIARALENAYRFGAKVIASDLVFSEPTDRPEVRLVNKLRQEVKLPQNVNAQLQAQLNETDNDKIYADFVHAHQTDLVLGSFSASHVNDSAIPPGFTDACEDVVYRDSDLARVIAAQNKPLVVIAQNEIDFPPQFSDFYKVALDQIETKIRNESPPPKTQIQKYQLNKKILNAKLNFCDSVFFGSIGGKSISFCAITTRGLFCAAMTLARSESR